MLIVRWLSALFTLLALVPACEERVPNERPLADHGPAPDPAVDPLGARLHAMGQRLIPRHEPEGGVLRGRLRQGEIEDHPVVLVGTHCYAVLGVASEGVQDLDLLLLDPNGAAVMHDTDEGQEASMGVREQICPATPGSFKVRVRAFRGEGDYAIRVFRYQVI